MSLCKKDTRSTFDIYTPQCVSFDTKLSEELEQCLTESVAQMDMTLVWCEVKSPIVKQIEQHPNEIEIIVAPTLAEAIDIVSMDDVMRDMMRESEE